MENEPELSAECESLFLVLENTGDADFLKECCNKFGTCMALAIHNLGITGNSASGDQKVAISLKNNCEIKAKIIRTFAIKFANLFKNKCKIADYNPYYNVMKFLYTEDTFVQIFIKHRQLIFRNYVQQMQRGNDENVTERFKTVSKKTVDMFANEDAFILDSCGLDTSVLQNLINFYLTQLSVFLSDTCNKIQEIQKNFEESEKHSKLWHLIESCCFVEEKLNEIRKKFHLNLPCTAFEWRLQLSPFINDILLKMKQDLSANTTANFHQEFDCLKEQILPEMCEHQFDLHHFPSTISASTTATIHFCNSVQHYAKFVKYCGGDPLRQVRLSFYEFLHEKCLEIRQHIGNIIKEVPCNASPKWFYILIGSLVVIIRTLLQSIPAYEQEIRLNLKDLEKVLEEKIVSYHKRVLSTAVLHDDDSNNWNSTKPFFENEICSFSVQFWGFHFEALRADLWTFVPADTARRVFLAVLEYSLDILSTRYKSIKTSPIRVKQIKADILTILFLTSEMIFWCSRDPSEILLLRRIHTHCSVLFTTLVIRIAPLDQLNELVKETSAMNKIMELNCNRVYGWFGLIYPIVELNGFDANMEVFMLLKTLVSKPTVNYELLLKVILVGQCTVPSIMLKDPMFESEMGDAKQLTFFSKPPLPVITIKNCVLSWDQVGKLVFYQSDCSFIPTKASILERGGATEKGQFIIGLYEILSRCSPTYSHLLSHIIIPWMQKSIVSIDCMITSNVSYHDLPLCLQSLLEWLKPFFERIVKGILCIWQEISLGESIDDVASAAKIFSEKIPTIFIYDFRTILIQHILSMIGQVMQEIPKPVIILLLQMKALYGSEETHFILSILLTGTMYVMKDVDAEIQDVALLDLIATDLKNIISSPEEEIDKMDRYVNNKILNDKYWSDVGVERIACEVDDLNIECQYILNSNMGISSNGIAAALNCAYNFISSCTNWIIGNLGVENSLIPTGHLGKFMESSSVGIFQPFDWFRNVDDTFFKQVELDKVNLQWERLVQLIYPPTFNISDLLSVRSWGVNLESRQEEEEFITKLKLLQVKTA